MIDVMHPSARKSVLVSGPMLYSLMVFPGGMRGFRTTQRGKARIDPNSM